MKKVAISIPVHQSPDCVEEQVRNIIKYVPNCVIVLHASKDDPNFINKLKPLINKYSSVLYINPYQFPTYARAEAANVSKLSSVHASNIQYINSVVKDLDVMAFDTSNDMFVRKGIEKTFEEFDWGCNAVIRQDPSTFFDPGIINRLELVSPIKYVCKSAQEGFWCNIGAALYFANKIQELEKLIKEPISSEEGTLANLVMNSGEIDIDKNSGTRYVFHDSSEGRSVAKSSILKVRNGELPHVYSVKRVPRTFNHPTRLYVRELTKND